MRNRRIQVSLRKQHKPERIVCLGASWREFEHMFETYARGIKVPTLQRSEAFLIDRFGLRRTLFLRSSVSQPGETHQKNSDVQGFADHGVEPQTRNHI